MLRTRIIPALLLRNESLVKTVRFNKFRYIGDPCNTVRIFNELEVDELLFLDILATREGSAPNIKLLSDIAEECFMPLGYGGGVTTLEQATKILQTGFEKIAVNTYSTTNPSFIAELADQCGSQAVIASIDVKRNLLGKYRIYSHAGRVCTHRDPIEWAQELEHLGAGEILLTSIEREGSWSGFDLDLIKAVTESVEIPVIAHGGAGTLNHISQVVQQANASAVALGSMVVFQKQGMGVLVNFPNPRDLAGI